MAEPHKPTDHALWEDAFAFLLGTGLVALGIQFLAHLGLITGQTAGLAVLLSYLTGWSFGALFFVVNLPFYILAWTRLGPRFTVKTVIAVAMLSILSELYPHLIRFDHLDPVLGALLAGGSMGLGLIAIFRHGASLGGIGVLALWLQERAGIQAGWVQLGFDAVLFLAAFAALPWKVVLLSLLGAAIVNLIVAVNHRRDRYIGR
ncbi:YitT family protein [Rhodobacterales bacterium HKCCE2091]|nr:YitT family protein [Rhodobacterales bacterium HKCCE2091]